MGTQPQDEEAVAAAAAERDWALRSMEQQTKQLPAQYANRLYVKPEGTMLRISFGELGPDGEEIYRSSFIVPVATALEMGDLLTRMATSNIEGQIKSWREWVAANPEHPQPNG